MRHQGDHEHLQRFIRSLRSVQQRTETDTHWYVDANGCDEITIGALQSQLTQSNITLYTSGTAR